MAASLQIKTLVLLFLLCDTTRLSWSETETLKEKEELSAEETKKLEIIKRIKKINDDGSYTIGYEADDGSFKIESRDVLGHIKGTYGFVDQDGQIKRVSYSTTNSSDILNKPPEETLPSVVQRIPSKKQSTTTFAFSTTQSTPVISTTTSVKQKPTSVSEVTQKPNYQNVINVARAAPISKYVTYTPATPKVLIQGKSVADQITKPDTVTISTTESSSHKQFNPVHEKPVTEELEPDARGNILRRELPQRLVPSYDPREHIFTLQQSMGKDVVDVYSSSMTTGTPRPLFTTTARPLRPALFSTDSTTHTSRAPIPYPVNYHKNSLQNIENTSHDHQQTTTDFPEPTPVSTAQTATRPDIPEPLVAIRHPNQRNTILVPLSQLQRKIIPVEQLRHFDEPSRQYYVQNNNRPAVVEIDQQQAVVRRLPHHLRPMPVQIDENGYVRELSVPYQVPVPRYVDDDDIDNIQPPVSTKDFQRLLQQLILRQSRLEKINALTRQPPETLVQQKYRQIYRPSYVQEPRSVHYLQQHQEQIQKYAESEQQQFVPLNNQQRPSIYEDYDSQSYRPTRRVARLLPNNLNQQQEQNEEYLPTDVREMLLLRMLQLAINPALPLDEDEIEVSRTSPVKRTPVRNVEILGEEESHEKSHE